MYSPKYTAIIDQRRTELRARLDAILPANGGRFLLEIGSGHGHFLAAYAAAHPDRLCVGIDIVGERVERAVRKRDRAKLGNLHFVQAEARLFLDTLPDAARIDAFFILFPDPWPKARHNKHRILQASFLRQAAARATVDCPLYFRTDFIPYFTAAREAVEHDPHWRLTEEPWPFEHVTVFQQRAPTHHSLSARCVFPPFAGAPTQSATRQEP